MKDTLGYGYYALNDCRIIPMSDAPHRIVYFCTSLLTLYSPRVHIVCLLLRGVG